MILPLLLRHPLYHCPLPSPPHAAAPLQDFVLLKERTLDEAPRPPKKAMDYSSSSEEVESSEDDDEESNGEPSEGSRDTPGARYGGTPTLETPQQKGCRLEGGASGASLREGGSPFLRVGSLGSQCQSVLSLSLECSMGLGSHPSPAVLSLGGSLFRCSSATSLPQVPGAGQLTAKQRLLSEAKCIVY